MGALLISVIYQDGTASEVSNDVLDVLIATGRIKRFKRADGWVEVTADRTQLRNYQQQKDYAGPERRAPWPKKQRSD